MGMPGVFTHGNFDTWSPGYLMFIAALHNGISRLYETFGNGGADTVERTLSPSDYSRTWYKQNPPYPKAMWSQRNNNNYEQTGLLTSLHFFADNREMFLRNFYLKAKRSITKPGTEGPAAYVFPANDPRPGGQAELLQVLQRQGCEISRATAAFNVMVPAPKPARRPGGAPPAGEQAPAGAQGQPRPSEQKPPAMVSREFPAGSYIVRMDQPYSRAADALLDHQFWSPNDPQRGIYDDTGWTFGELFRVQVVRVTDAKVLSAPMERVTDVKAPGGVSGSGTVYAINHNADNALATLRYKMKDASIKAAEEPFEASGHKFNRGTFLIDGVNASDLQRTATELGLQVYALSAAPEVKTHPIRAARVAVLHTWLSTQTEGWWRQALDKMQIPFTYISTQAVAKESDLRSKYDVILFPPTGRGGDPGLIVNGLPTTWGNPLPWKNTPLTPSMGTDDSTDDMRPGLAWEGVSHLKDFVNRGGVLVTVTDTANFAVALGMTPGVSVARPNQLRIIGSVVGARLIDGTSPIAYGYGDELSVYCYNGPIFNISNMGGGFGVGGRRGGGSRERATGRGTASEPDFVPGRPNEAIPEEPHAEIWEALPLTDEQRRNNSLVIPPADRPRVVFRYADSADLLVSGLVDGGGEIAQHAAVIDQPVGNGHIVLFSNNPVYRGETQGNYFLVLNTILNFDNLNAGRKLTEK
jgi:hypothetical protein